MMRSHVLIWPALLTGAIGLLFHTSHQAEELEAALSAGNRAVIAEQEAIRVLRAEWAYLNEPSRLRALARRHTPLGPAMPSQMIATLDDIPMALPGLGALPGLPLPPRKPLYGAVASVTPDRSEAASARSAAPPRPPEPARTSPPPMQRPSDPVQMLLTGFRARQAAQAEGGR